MNLTPAVVRAMTPEETDLLIAGWNAAHGDGGPAAPTHDEYEDLVKRYG